MKDFNLEYFTNNVSGKVIQVEYNNGEGDLISLVNLVINEAKIEHQTYFDILTINDNLQIYFEDIETNESDNCLCFNRRGKDLVRVYLPLDEVWEDNNLLTHGFVQY